MGRPRRQLSNIAITSLITAILWILKPACAACNCDRQLPCGSLVLLICLLLDPGPLPPPPYGALTVASGWSTLFGPRPR